MKSDQRPKGGRSAACCLFLYATTVLAGSLQGPAAAPTAAPDVVVFTNGDQLTGKLLREKGGTITFHSDVVGDLDISWDKIKTLQTGGQFAVVRDGQKIKLGQPNSDITQGTLSVSDGQLHVTPTVNGQAFTVPVGQAQYLIDEKTYQTQLQRKASLLEGWLGSLTLGAALVEGTQTNETLTGAANFVRLIPAVDWLDPRNRTTANFSAAYGILTQPLIAVDGQVIQSASSAKTNILHGDLERDEYIRPRFFYLVDASADHNISQGLRVQQQYGGGLGWTAIKQPNQTLDLKGDIHYERQEFYNGESSPLGTPTVNLIGANATEVYMRKLPRKLIFNESATISPAFNVPSAYSAIGIAGLVFPVYKNFSFTLGGQDNFLNNPPLGFKKNTFQFTAGLSYALK